jgi:tRNA-specific 2-thiouridylase
LARIVVAMSGGVDSSLAAALLCQEGHEVVGVTMQVWPEEAPEVLDRHGGCCGMGAVRDARAVADLLGIPHYVFNLREVFQRRVIDAFAAAYARGRTPNPCIACNDHIKFRALLDKVDRLGADGLATGHYARSEPDPAYGRVVLRRAADRRKDQSYVLYPLPAGDLPRIRFPLGGRTKAETREAARRLGLPVADKPDSQEICFVGPEGYAALVAAHRPDAAVPGPIEDAAGRCLGTHRGIASYTVGQRRGLGLPGGPARYVVRLEAERNAVVVGGIEDLESCGCIAEDVRWLAVDGLDGALRVAAQVRAGAGEVGAVLTPAGDGEVRVVFDRPVRAVTPGQAVVFYSGDVVLGGGTIARAWADRPGTGAAGAGAGR